MISHGRVDDPPAHRGPDFEIDLLGERIRQAVHSQGFQAAPLRHRRVDARREDVHDDDAVRWGPPDRIDHERAEELLPFFLEFLVRVLLGPVHVGSRRTRQELEYLGPAGLDPDLGQGVRWPRLEAVHRDRSVQLVSNRDP